ncbi:hypothetical protein RMATCC62417_08590 [Rhizopus microsporus]|nr:hypothetical protein RMATCC62417_08590 [Rhizopus microsporus]
MDKRATNSAALPEGLLENWNLFRQSHRSIIYTKNIASGASQCLSEACVQLATAYTNCIVENFEARLLKYLSYLIQNTFVSMTYQDVKKIAYDYCYQSVCKGEPKWPQGATFTQETKTTVDEVCLPLQQLITKQVTLKELSASPSTFLPCILYILSKYEAEHKDNHAYDVRRLPLPRLFAALPSPSLHWRFVNISANFLSAFVKEALPRGYSDQLRMFYRVFNFKKLRINSIDALLPSQNNKIMFANTVKTDGFSVDFVFNKRTTKNTSLAANIDLELEDFDLEEVQQTYLPMFLDPGRKSVFTAAVGFDKAKHQIRRCSTAEYYHMTGSTKYMKKLEKTKG